MNTAVAAAYVGADFSSSKFKGFYRADFNYENGIYVEGLGSKGTTRGRQRIGGGPLRFIGFGEPGASVEFEDGHIDVDLYHNRSLKGLVEHGKEVNFNKRHKRGTHPGDVVKRLKDVAGINTGVSCD